MRLANGAHLTYCLNVHPGETWAESLQAIRTHVPGVKQRCSPDQPFGLGLRISGKASEEGQIPDLQQTLDETGTYAFTVNAFPHGAFHDTRVKETVYLPDWTDPRRKDYTLQVARLLAGVLAEGMEGSISTVPIGYRFGAALDLDLVRQHLRDTALGLEQIQDSTGKRIHLGLEPEPDCLLETTEETVSFLQSLYDSDPGGASERRIGVCVDTCHVALQFEDPAWALRRYQEAGILISKIQLSAALELETDNLTPELLRPFNDGVYFHQVTSSSGKRWRDLPDLLASPDPEAGTLRIHCHVPLDWEGQTLTSTRHTLSDAFWQEIRDLKAPHLEVETYTFDVLPEEVRSGKSVEENMADECLWARKYISGLKEVDSSLF